MSSDNGVYYHKFEDGWRVCHAQAVDSIYVLDGEDGYNEDTLWEYFKDSPLYNTEQEAILAASALHSSLGHTEYGVHEI